MTSAALLPPAEFAARELDLVPLPAARFFRAYRRVFPDPLGFKPMPSRFSDPSIGTPNATPYGTIYLGESVETCVLESLIRDSGDGRAGLEIPVSEDDLTALNIAQVVSIEPLRLLDLRFGGSLRAGVPADAIRARDHALGQAWSRAIHDHSLGPDGILFSSRFNERVNAAIFDRAISKLYKHSRESPVFQCGDESAPRSGDLLSGLVPAVRKL